MKHLNGNLLCVVWCEVTGFSVDTGYLGEIFIAPVMGNFEKLMTSKMFYAKIKPTGFLDPIEAAKCNKRDKEKYYTWLGEMVSYKQQDLIRLMWEGIDPLMAGDMLERWLGSWNLPPFKQIMVVSHQWSFQQPFVEKWLGQLSYREWFHPYVRDTVAASLLQNDAARGLTSYLWQKNDLTYLANCIEERDPSKVMKIFKVYRHMVRNYHRNAS